MQKQDTQPFTMLRCEVCKGRGRVNWEKEICKACRGKGYILVNNLTGKEAGEGGQNEGK